MNFKDSNKTKQLWILTTPLIVPITDDPDKEDSDQLVLRQEKYLKLSQSIKIKLSSVLTSQKIQAIGQKYGFELLRLANITRLIREYYFGEVRFEDFVTEIEKRMSVSLLTAQEITRYLKQEIIDWDPWAEYLAKLPKMPVREIVAKHPKIAETEITAGYVELRNSDELEDPSIKNWLQDYISHLGYEKHSQMQRTEYLFHSENAKNLSSQDREKLGIILRSFDENIPLPVDEENGEIVFESVTSDQRTENNNPIPTAVPKSQPAPQPSFAKATAGKQESFIKPYSPAQQPRPTLPPRQASSPQPAQIPYKVTSSVPEIDKYFNANESSEIPEIKIHSMTEHNEPQVVPQPTIQRPAPVSPRPQYKIIDPFTHTMPEPKIDGNIVDLSSQK